MQPGCCSRSDTPVCSAPLCWYASLSEHWAACLEAHAAGCSSPRPRDKNHGARSPGPRGADRGTQPSTPCSSSWLLSDPQGGPSLLPGSLCASGRGGPLPSCHGAGPRPPSVFWTEVLSSGKAGRAQARRALCHSLSPTTLLPRYALCITAQSSRATPLRAGALEVGFISTSCPSSRRGPWQWTPVISW